MEQCFKALRSANTQWILEGDIKSCFDKISHDWFLAHVLLDRVIRTIKAAHGVSAADLIDQLNPEIRVRPTIIGTW